MDCFSNIIVLTQNVHKSGKTVKNLLEQYANAADILFIQEAPFPHIQKTVSTTSEEGDVVDGPPIHAAWQAVHCFERHPKTQVCSYVNCRLLSRFQLSLDLAINTEPNVLLLTLSSCLGAHSATFGNVYNPPRSADHAVKALLRLMPLVKDLKLLVGDFNIKSVEWDPPPTLGHMSSPPTSWPLAPSRIWILSTTMESPLSTMNSTGAPSSTSSLSLALGSKTTSSTGAPVITRFSG